MLELFNLNESYRLITKHVAKIYRSRLWHAMLEDFVVKYLWGSAGYALCAVPVFFEFASVVASQLDEQVAKRTQHFITNRRLLVSASDSYGRIMYFHLINKVFLSRDYRTCWICCESKRVD